MRRQLYEIHARLEARNQGIKNDVEEVCSVIAEPSYDGADSVDLEDSLDTASVPDEAFDVKFLRNQEASLRNQEAILRSVEALLRNQEALLRNQETTNVLLSEILRKP